MTTITIHITFPLPASGQQQQNRCHRGEGRQQQQQQQGTEGASAAPVDPAPASEPAPAPPPPLRADRNGWIHSRTPGPGDADIDGDVWVPRRPGLKEYRCAHHNIVVPGQPWAPIHTKPGPYEP